MWWSASVAVDDPLFYDCAACLRRFSDQHRRWSGCRRIDPNSSSSEPIVAFDGTPHEIRADHCPGIEVSTPFVWSIWRLRNSQRAGYTLGNLNDAPAPQVEAVLHLENALAVADDIRARNNG